MSCCKGCGREWGGHREAHCATCHQHFGSTSAFDRHQRDVTGTCDFPGLVLKSGDPRCVWNPQRRLWVRSALPARMREAS